jgi:phosphoribosyl-ATP pyrophosphohydrolase/phosphoribosyl-AMP cyclohydrolase
MNINFNKSDGLVPVIVQDAVNMQVLMLGYMNEEALAKTNEVGKVVFYSRSKQRLWMKGETSGNFLFVNEIKVDCDNDTILIMANPVGPVCHTGTQTCFGEVNSKGFLYKLEETIHKRIDENDETSYTNKLFKKGINKVAQKVGEEAVELVIEAKDNDDNLFLNEAADLIYHFLILLKAKNHTLSQVEKILTERTKK